MVNKVILLVCSVLLFGCEHMRQTETNKVDVTYTSDFDRRHHVGTHSVEITTFAENKTSWGTYSSLYDQILGVPCTLKGRGFRADFKSPARIKVPDLGYRSQPIYGQCELQGIVRTFELTPYNITKDEKLSEKTERGALGDIASIFVGDLGYEVLKDPFETDRYHEFGYEDARVSFPKKQVKLP